MSQFRGRRRRGRQTGSLIAGLLAASVGAAPVPALIGTDAADGTTPLIDADIDTIEQAQQAGKTTAEAMTRAHLSRIVAYDRGGPALNALIAIDPEAPVEAAALDRERAGQGARGPLHGLALVIADDLDTAGLATTGGSAALRGRVPEHDATVVARLRDAGALILAKANLSELGLDLGLPGYSSAGGQTRNPYRPARVAQGTGAAVAAGLAVAGVAADTLGGLRVQAADTGLVGIRPTLGLTSRAGLLPAALSLDATGPVARTVRGAALLLGIMAGVDEADPRTAEAESHLVGDYTLFLDEKALDGARIGVATDYHGGNREVDAAFRQAQADLRGAGAELIDIDVPRRVLEARSRLLDKVLETEPADQLHAYLRHSGEGMPHGLATLTRISRSPLIEGSPTPVSPARLAAYDAALASPGLADVEYLTVLANGLPAARAEIAELLRAKELDALVFPTTLCPAASRYDAYDESYDCDADDPGLPAYLASSTGFPEITVPMGLTRAGLPMGLSFFGPAYAEPRLLALAFAFEQATGRRRPPDLAGSGAGADDVDSAPDGEGE